MRARSIVCGVDFSKASAAALRSAAVLAHRSGRRLIVLFVEDPLLAAAAKAAGDERAAISTTTAALERFIAKALGRAKRPQRRAAVAIGRPADEILRIARREGAELIVLGTRGMGNAARLLLGSTADAVLRRARVPVLAVPS